MIYALCSRKDQYTYEAIWNSLKEVRPTLNVTHLMFDFEMAALNAAREAFPDAQVHACLFHLGKNIFKKIVENGLRQTYIGDDAFAHKMKMIGALAFVPLDMVIFKSKLCNFCHSNSFFLHKFISI